MNNDPCSTFESVRIVCVGDIILDRYVMGAVERISPEAPVPVLKVGSERQVLGGVGNVASNIASLGAKSLTVALVGDDAGAHDLQRLLSALHGCDEKLVISPCVTTTVKTRCVGGHQQMLRIDHDARGTPSKADREMMVSVAFDALPDAQALLISDYGKGALDRASTQSLIAEANRLSIPVVIDPKGPSYEAYRHATLATPNLQELAQATGQSVSTDAEIEKAAIGLLEKFGIQAMLVTMSEKGMMLVRAGSASLRVDTTAQEVYDVSGAGDTVAAVMACAMGGGESLEQATELANLAAGLVVAKLGTATVTAEEIAEAVRGRSLSNIEQKLHATAGLLRTVDRWRSQGLTIGFTNGCFDLLHPGHVTLLAQARRKCDRLIVALNTDASVRRLKGDDRPVQSELARATVIASMADVDAVVLFGQDTPLELIKTVRPDVLVKGADYRLEQVVGGDFVVENGGEVVLIELLDGQSTTRLVSKTTR